MIPFPVTSQSDMGVIRKRKKKKKSNAGQRHANDLPSLLEREENKKYIQNATTPNMKILRKFFLAF